jgi:hypothetical protein
VSKENWADKIKNKGSAASEFLRPHAASDQEETNPINNDNANVNNNINNDQIQQNEPDFLDTLLEPGQKKKNDLILTGIYLQPDLAKILDSLGKKGGRGAKSRLVNDALRKLFNEKGLL